MFHLRLQVRSLAALSIASSVGFCAASTAVVETNDQVHESDDTTPQTQFLAHHASDDDPTEQAGLRQRKHEQGNTVSESEIQTVTKESSSDSQAAESAKPSNTEDPFRSGKSLSKHPTVVNSDRDGACPVQKLMKYLPTGVVPYVQAVYDVVKPIKQGMREKVGQLREKGCGPCKRRREKDSSEESKPLKTKLTE